MTAYAPPTTAPPTAPSHPTRRRRIWHAVTDYRDVGDQWIVHDLRIPRTVLALLVGLALGLSRTVIQAVGRNPLADSEILGINSGAALFVVSAIAFLGTTGIWTYIGFAFAGGLFAMLLVYLVGMTGRGTPVRVLLAGVAVGAVMDGIGYGVRLRNPRAFDNMRFWDAGALDGRSLEVAGAIAPTGAVEQIYCDAVIYATGFLPAQLRGILGDLCDDVVMDDVGHPVVSRDYRLATTRPPSGGLFIQGNTEHTHGLTSSLSSNIAVRSAEILQSIDASRLSPAGNASR